MEYNKRVKMKVERTDTKKLIKDYQTYSPDGKRYARKEFMERKVPKNQLPYKKRQKRNDDPFAFW